MCSRREADRQIEAGKVGIDGVTAKTGDRVLKGQTVTYNGQVVSKEEEMILIALNKPAASSQQKKGKKQRDRLS